MALRISAATSIDNDMHMKTSHCGTSSVVVFRITPWDGDEF